MKGFRRLSAITLTASIALVAIGGFVRASGSGEGCGPGEGDSWPLCVGGILPPLEYHALVEFSHRLLAGVLVLLTVALAVWAWRRFRDRADLVRASFASVGLVVAQALLGGIVVAQDTEKYLVAIHFAMAMLLVGVLTYLLVRTFPLAVPADSGGRAAAFSRITTWLTITTFALLVVGAYVRGSDAGWVFGDWPLMGGRLIPDLGGRATTMFLHRLLALSSALLALLTFAHARAWTQAPVLRRLTWLMTGLLATQIAAGAINVLTVGDSWVIVLHVSLSAAVWASVVALATVARTYARQADTATVTDGAATPDASFGQQAGAYFQLMKPRIILLLLITTVPAMILAETRLPSVWLVLAVLFGGTLAAGSANAINCYLDRDIDEVMRRTRKRPLPSHQVTPDQALSFGFALGAISFFFLAIVVNVLAATLAMAAIAFYVLIYTLWLKRRTAQNIVIGGAAGAAPVLIGWAAVTGHVAAPALVMFAIIFVWTPPHFWALAMTYADDYARANVPMLPVVRTRAETLTQIVLYSLALFLVSLALVPVAEMGQIYLASAVILGAVFVFRALRLRSNYSPGAAFGFFKFSILYLALLFAAVAVDGLVA